MKKIWSLFFVVLLVAICFLMPSQRVDAAKVAMSKKSTTIYVGKKETLKVKGTKKKVTWSTSNSKVATVSSKGVVTAKKAGTVTITAKVSKTKYKCKVTVKKPYLSSTKASMYEGYTKKLYITGTTVSKWATTNSKVATVSKSGVVTAKKAGTATIKVSCKNKKTYSCVITVKKPYLSSTSAKIHEGSTKKLTLTGATVKSFTSSNTKAATITSKGLITAKAAGTTTIKVIDTKNRAYSCKITVEGHSYSYLYGTYASTAKGVRYKKCKCGHIVSREYLLSIAKQTGVSNITFSGAQKTTAAYLGYYPANKVLTIILTPATGYHLTSWDNSVVQSQRGSTTVSYTTKARPTILSYVVAKNKSRLTINLNGGVINSSTGSLYYEQDAGTTLVIAEPTYSGADAEEYQFTGWTFTGNHGGVTGTTGQITYTFGTANGTEDTLTANWEHVGHANVTVHYLTENIGVEDSSVHTSDTYTVNKSDTVDAIVGEDVEIQPIRIAGFTEPASQYVDVAEDGSTEVTFYYTRNFYRLEIVKDATITDVTTSGSGTTYEYGEIVDASARLATPSEDKLPRWTPSLNGLAVSYTIMKDARYSTEAIHFTMPAGDVSIAVTEGDFTGIIKDDGSRITWYDLVNIYGMNVDYGYKAEQRAATVIDSNHLVGHLILDPMQYSISTQYAGCTSITKLTVPSSLQIRASYAFSGCSNMEEVDLQCGLPTVNYMGIFSDCTKLKTFTWVGTDNTYVQGNTFENCSSLDNIVIPANITNIQGYAFRNCTNLKSITFLNDNCGIYYDVFEGCSSLETITLPRNLKTVYTELFKNCTSLKTVVFPTSTLTEIGQGAFIGCTSLEHVEIPAGVEKIGGAAFRGCTSLKKVYMPSNNYRMESQYSGQKNAWFGECGSQVHVYIGEQPAAVTFQSLYFNNDEMGYDDTNCDGINHAELYFATHVTYGATMEAYNEAE